MSFFKHHRKVEHRDGHPTRELAGLKKTIYSLIDLREILLLGCNHRYLAFLSSLDDPAPASAIRSLSSAAPAWAPIRRSGLNFFNATDQTLRTVRSTVSSTYTDGAGPTCLRGRAITRPHRP